MQTEKCREFREMLAEGREGSPLDHSAMEQHAADCPECALFRERLAMIDRIGEVAGRMAVEPDEASRERLRAGWQHLAVRSSWLDRFKHWHQYFFEPQVLRPLTPHAAMIVGFMFFTYTIVVLQAQTGLLTLKVKGEAPKAMVAEVSDSPAYQDVKVFKG